MDKTFKRPLVGKRKDTPAPHGVFDYKAVRDGYDRLGGNPFGIQPSALKPVWYCDASGCSRSVDPNTKTETGRCVGYCVGG